MVILSLSLAMTDQVAWTTRQLSGKKNGLAGEGGVVDGRTAEADTAISGTA